MISISDFVSRLDKATGSGDRWIACCPAHDDKSPSMSVTDKGDRILFHCHAGCSPHDILEAVGLKWADVCSGDDWKAARNMAYLTGAAKLRKPSEEMMDRAVLALAASALRRGETLSIEDQARIIIAKQRIETNYAAT